MATYSLNAIGKPIPGDASVQLSEMPRKDFASGVTQHEARGGHGREQRPYMDDSYRSHIIGYT